MFVELGNQRKPIIKIEDNNKDRIVCSPMFREDTHITLHKEGDGIRKNLYDKKYISVHSEARKTAAKHYGYKSWGKHGSYLFQQKYNFPDDIPLLSCKIDFPSIPDKIKEKYLKNYYVFNITTKTFWLAIYFSENHSINSLKDSEKLNIINLSFGNLFFQLTT